MWHKARRDCAIIQQENADVKNFIVIRLNILLQATVY